MTASPRTRRVALLVGCAAFTVFLTNLRPMGSGDTIPARLLPFSLLREGNLDLDEFGWLRATLSRRPYFLQRDGAGHWRSKYPVATPLVAAPLAAPFVWWARAHDVDDGDARFRLLTAVFERLAAALIGAVSVALVLLAAREVAPLGWAVAAAALYALGTSTWVYSQALWQHGLAEVAIAGAALCALRPASGARALLIGAAAALALAARPTTLLIAGIFGLYMWRERRAGFWRFAGAFTAGALVLVAYNWTVMARPTGGYSPRALTMPSVESLLGVLVSPSRGLVLYCPLALLALAALRRRTAPIALRFFALALPAYVAFFASTRVWWGGYSYGPRFFTDIMPLVVLCALPSARALWARRGGRALLVAGAAWGVAVQAIGVYCDDNDWNNFPVSVDRQTARLWAWSDPQILRALRSGWHGWEFAPLLGQLVSDPHPAPLVALESADLSGSIAAVAVPPWHCRAGAWCPLAVRVANRSAAAVWPGYSDFGNLEVGLGAVWRAGDVVELGVGGFVPLRRHIGPGGVAEARVSVEAPRRAGSYQLELVVVQNLGGAGRRGDAALVFPVVVE